MYIIFFAILFVIFIYFSKEVTELRRRISILEKSRTVVLEQYHANNSSSHGEENVGSTFSQQNHTQVHNALPQQYPETIKMESGTDILSRFGEWYKVDWMLKTGVLFLLSGLGWFVTYAFMNNWIGASGRITLGYLFGVALLVYGWVKMHDSSFAKKAAAFFVLGASTVMVTTYSAHMVYNMFPTITAMSIMYLTSAFVSVCAIRFVKTLDLVGLVLAAIAPLLVHSSGNVTLLFMYLFMVVLGSHVIVHITGRREVIFAGLLMVSLYSAPYILQKSSYAHQNDYGVLLMFAYAFTTIFFFASIIGILRSNSAKEYKPSTADIATACGTGLFLITWVIVSASKELQSLILIAWMIVFSVGAFLVFKKTERKEPFYGYALVSLVLLGTATALQFKGDALLFAFIFEATAVVFSADILLRTKEVTRILSFTFIIPILLSLEYLAKSMPDISILLLSLALLALALKMYRNEMNSPEREYSLFQVYLVSGSIYFWIYVWNVMHVITTARIGTIITLIIYTVSGLIIYGLGNQKESKGVKLYGSVLVGFVIGRLILVDVWSMDIFGRVIVFIVVGALLMSTAFMVKKKPVIS